MSRNLSGQPNGRPRIAIFQAYWRLHSSTIFSALMLADAGYSVDVFLYKVDISLPADMLAHSPHILIHSFEPEMLQAGKGNQNRPDEIAKVWVQRAIAHVLFRGRSALRRLINEGLLYLRSDAGLIPREIIRRTAAITERGCYKAMIGVDKGGMIWAGAIARIQPCALIYHSLELYTADVWSIGGLWHKRMKVAEEKAHKRCWATIVQDPARGRVLLKDNNITNDMKMLYVPISRMGGRAISKPSCWRNSLGINQAQIVILYHGMIAENRLCAELATLAQAFPDDWFLVFHGWGQDSMIQKLSEIDARQKVRFSLQLVELADEPKIVGSANITLVLYQKETENDYLTGFSSEKLALSLQCGVPVIAFNYPSYAHIREEGCGILIDELSQIPQAVKEILANHASYSSRAYRTFEKYYSFEANFQKVLAALEELD